MVCLIVTPPSTYDSEPDLTNEENLWRWWTRDTYTRTHAYTHPHPHPHPHPHTLKTNTMALPLEQAYYYLDPLLSYF